MVFKLLYAPKFPNTDSARVTNTTKTLKRKRKEGKKKKKDSAALRKTFSLPHNLGPC